MYEVTKTYFCPADGRAQEHVGYSISSIEVLGVVGDRLFAVDARGNQFSGPRSEFFATKAEAEAAIRMGAV